MRLWKRRYLGAGLVLLGLLGLLLFSQTTEVHVAIQVRELRTDEVVTNVHATFFQWHRHPVLRRIKSLPFAWRARLDQWQLDSSTGLLHVRKSQLISGEVSCVVSAPGYDPCKFELAAPEQFKAAPRIKSKNGGLVLYLEAEAQTNEYFKLLLTDPPKAPIAP